MAKVALTINGKKLIADSNKTILEVVHENNLDQIPTLCYEKQLAPYNSCYVCVVEVKGRPNLMPSCSTKVQANMEVFTQTPRVMNARQAALELLLSNHYADCLPPCSMTCPAGVDIQGYIALIHKGMYQEAVQLIKQTNPLPAVCGRVCTRPCELACRRNLLDERVGIDFLKRFAADFDLETALHHIKPQVEPDKNMKVAIVGGGPAGLSAAYYLRIKGYQVTIFEAMPDAGGMLRYGIPTYRLPFDILDREIDTILELGVDLKTNMALGEDFSLQSLFDQEYRSIFLGMGAWGSRNLGAPGQDSEGVLSGIKFLEQVGRNQPPKIFGKVVVVGGGNTAIDCARTSLRMHADEVVLLYRRTRKEMPANEMEIDAAEEEGVKMHFLAAPVEVIPENNRVKSIRCIKMELGEPDASGRRRPVPIPGSEFVLDCDFVFAAIGQSPKLDVLYAESEKLLSEDQKLKLTRWGSIEADPDTFETAVPGVFAGGDMFTGAATVIEAIAAGRKAAHAIDSYLQLGVAQPEKTYFNSRKDDFKEVTKKDLRYQETIDKRPMPELPPKERIADFSEVELGYTEEDARHESSRCLECGCQELFTCKLREYATDYHVKVDRYKGEIHEYELDHSHPLIELDPNKCILCARCIRVCSEIVGASVYGYEFRGFDTIVRPTMGLPLVETECISCGLCISTCPTGAISERSVHSKPGPWKLSGVRTTCTFCGVGCSMSLNYLGDKVMNVRADEEPSLTNGNLCGSGRFGFGFIHSPKRLVKPVLRNADGETVLDWPGALKQSRSMIKDIVMKYAGNEIGVFVSPRLTNEEMYLTQKFARVVLKTHNITSITQAVNPDNNPFVQSTAGYRDIQSADVILITTAHLRRDHKVADFMVRQARNAGCRVIYVGPAEDRFLKDLDVYLKVKPGSEAWIIKALMRVMRRYPDSDKTIEDMPELVRNTGVSLMRLFPVAQMLHEAKRPVIIADRHFEGPRTKGDLHLLNMFSQAIRAGLVLISQSNNSQGLMDMGCIPEYFPGYQPVSDTAVLEKFEKGWSSDLGKIPAPSTNMYQDLIDGKFKAVLIFGEDLLALDSDGKIAQALEKADYVIASDVMATPTTNAADLVIPMTSFAETNGTFTNGTRGIGIVKQAIAPLSGKEFRNVISEMAVELGVRFKFPYKSVSDVQDEIAELVPTHESVDFNSEFYGLQWDLDAFPLTIDSAELQIVMESDPVPYTLRPTKPANIIKRWFKGFWRDIGLLK